MKEKILSVLSVIIITSFTLYAQKKEHNLEVDINLYVDTIGPIEPIIFEFILKNVSNSEISTQDPFAYQAVIIELYDPKRASWVFIQNGIGNGLSEPSTNTILPRNSYLGEWTATRQINRLLRRVPEDGWYKFKVTYFIKKSHPIKKDSKFSITKKFQVHVSNYSDKEALVFEKLKNLKHYDFVFDPKLSIWKYENNQLQIQEILTNYPETKFTDWLKYRLAMIYAVGTNKTEEELKKSRKILKEIHETTANPYLREKVSTSLVSLEEKLRILRYWKN